MPTPAVVMRGISKTFPGFYRSIRANDAVDLTVAEGEVHAIVGENGAGKSTLMNILYGLLEPDEGEIEVFGQSTSISHPRHAIQLGIGMIHQHFMLVPSFTIGENIVLGREPVRAGLLDREGIRRIVESLSEKHGLKVDPDLTMGGTPVGVQQRVEILKVLYRGARVLILDEPTAVLTPQEVDDLFTALRKLALGGRSVILITHKLSEVLSLADRVTVMRGGVVVGRVAKSELADERRLAELIVGREVGVEAIEEHRSKRSSGSQTKAQPVIEVEDLHCHDVRGVPSLRGVRFSLLPGEILGVAGVAQNGQEALADALTGVRPPTSGAVRLDDRDISHLTVRQIRDLGLGHVPADRYQQGCAKSVSLARNLIMGAHHRLPIGGRFLLDSQQMVRWSDALIREYDIAAAAPDVPVSDLSGGNAQKAIVAREMELAQRCLIAEEPTRGVDWGACELIYERLLRLRAHGVAILLISSDLTELLRLSDRLLVMFRGRIVGECRPEETTPEELGMWMTGVLGS